MENSDVEGSDIENLTASDMEGMEMENSAGSDMENSAGSDMENYREKLEKIQKQEGDEIDLSGFGFGVLTPKIIGLLDRFKIIRIRGNNLEGLPPEIGNLTNLESLDISQENNPLGILTSFVLPPEIKKLKRLKYLNIFMPRSMRIPPEIGQLENLEEIVLPLNAVLPKEFFGLKKLRRVSNVPQGQIKQFLEFENLEVSKNILEYIPSGFFDDTASESEGADLYDIDWN